MKQKSRTIGVIIRGDRNAVNQDIGYACIADSLISVRPDELDEAVEFIRHKASLHSADCFAVDQLTNEDLDLWPLIEEMESTLSDGRSAQSIEIAHSKVTPQLFHHILKTWKFAKFEYCAFQPGWWSAPQDTKCETIQTEGCTFAPPPDTRVGMAAWPTLKWVGIWDPFPDSHYGVGLCPDIVKPAPFPSEFEANTTKAIRAFAGDDIESLIVTPELAEELATWPVRRKLKRISLPCITPEAFEWVLQHRNLRDLSFSDDQSPQLDLSKLSSLRKLRHVSPGQDEFLRNEHIIELLKIPTLRSLDVYYGKKHLTPALWPHILRSPLRNIMVSESLLEGEMPTDLPDTTHLKDVLAINVPKTCVQFQHALLDRYPGMVLAEQ